MPWHSSRNISKQQNLPHKTKGDTKMTKNFEKTIKAQKKTKLSTPWPYGYPLAPNSLWGLVFLKKFSRFFFVFFWPKTTKNLEKTKKHTKAPKLSTLWPYGYPLAPHSLWSFFFGFSRVFFCFWPKVAKTSRKQKHTKAPKLLTLWPVCGVFFVFGQKWQTPPENKKTSGYPLAPHSLWSLFFLVFSSFFFSSFFFWFLTKSCKNLEKTKKNFTSSDPHHDISKQRRVCREMSC